LWSRAVGRMSIEGFGRCFGGRCGEVSMRLYQGALFTIYDFGFTILHIHKAST
jgi:hypothetical protein